MLRCLTVPTTKEGKCKRDPPCELWEEELLLEGHERRRHYPMGPVAPVQPVAPVVRVAPQPVVPAPRIVAHYDFGGFDNDLDWMDNPRKSFAFDHPRSFLLIVLQASCVGATGSPPT
jgi:hypothetical protein